MFWMQAIPSALFLVRRTRSVVWDRIAGASAELGVMFTGLALALEGDAGWGRLVTDGLAAGRLPDELLDLHTPRQLVALGAILEQLCRRVPRADVLGKRARCVGDVAHPRVRLWRRDQGHPRARDVA